MNQSVKYRQTATECYEAARILSDLREKTRMLAMAQSWILLADQAERNNHLEAATTRLVGHRVSLCSRRCNNSEQDNTEVNKRYVPKAAPCQVVREYGRQGT
jgi:hypothetical protein